MSPARLKNAVLALGRRQAALFFYGLVEGLAEETGQRRHSPAVEQPVMMMRPMGSLTWSVGPSFPITHFWAAILHQEQGGNIHAATLPTSNVTLTFTSIIPHTQGHDIQQKH